MNNSADPETISFYDVPLVCGAAPSIGCGSRAKPLLIDLERQTSIKEAWLNRTGTIVAVVWRGPVCTEEVGRPLFERHEVQYDERRNDRETAQFSRTNGNWLHGPEVDRLSLEEARQIAETSVTSAIRDGLVSVEEATQITCDTEAYFRNELVKFRTRQALLLDARGKFPQAILNVYEKHVGNERTAAVRARGIQNPFDHAAREEISSCCP